jgi:hypothetical protein
MFGMLGCTTQTASAPATPSTAGDEYVTVRETGSRITRQVKKSELSKVQSPDTKVVSGQGWSTVGGDGGNAPSATAAGGR